MIALLRSIIHMVFMVVTIIPYSFAVVLLGWMGARQSVVYNIGVAWLRLSVNAAHWFMGVRYEIQGFENLPVDEKSGAVLLVKHQSTYETFLVPAIMPHPIAYVFKRELLKLPFFGWAIGMLDMIHIDRSQRARAFLKVVERGRELLNKGVWVVMFPEGTRIERGQAGEYKTGGSRLAIETGVPVIPIAITSARCWPRKAFIKYPGVVDVSIGKPISSVGRQSDDLMQEVSQWIESEMRRLDPEAYSQSEISEKS
jgi:1-acyl-sn-glycerol-3-phosphate acyltransferase